MKKLMLCSVLSLIGLFACVESREADPDPAPEAATEIDLHGGELTPGAPAESSLTLCCIDYTCPTDYFTTTGCRTGAGPSIAEAYDECNEACPVTCASSGLYCM